MDPNKCSAIRVQCCNPFKKPNHFVRDRKKLRSVTLWMLELFPEIPSGSVLCDTCRKDLTKLKKAEEEDSSGPEVNITNNDPDFSTT